MITLYPDQEEFIGEIRKLWPSHKRIACQASTGFGKTRVAARIIEGCISKGLRVCFVVPRITLIDQTAKAFRELGLTDITYIWAGFDTDKRAKIAIASVDTLIRREKTDYDLYIIDEVHRKRKVLLEWMNGHPEDRYIGLSATLFADWIGSYYTALAKARPMWWLIENKRLAPYEVFCPTKPDLSNCKTIQTSLGKDYVQSDISEVMGDYKLAGDIVQNWLENGENRPTVVLAINKAHAGNLTQEFTKQGITAELITDKTPVDERKLIFARVREGITKILLSIDCLTEGFDMVEISCLINARPTKSKARFTQGIGRSLRYAPGKVALIFDHAGSFLDPDLGFVEYLDIDELSSKSDGLNDAESKRKELERLEKAPKECPKCKFLKPVGMRSCVKCGFTPIFGEEVETNIALRMTAIKKDLSEKQNTQPTKADKQLWYSHLLGYKKERSMTSKPISSGYVAHMYKRKFGVWPRGLKESAKVPNVEIRNWIKSQQIRYAKGKGKDKQNANPKIRESALNTMRDTLGSAN